MTARRRRPGTPRPRPWQPVRPARRVVSPQMAELAARDTQVAELLEKPTETWRNDEYVITVRRRDDGSVSSLSIRRDDRRAARDWRDFQRIKNEIAGPEIEAVELYPAQARLVDSANQYWLWCLPPGVPFPFGFTDRSVKDTPDARFPKARQRPFDDRGGADARR